MARDERVAPALDDAGIDSQGYDWELPETTMRVESREPPLLAVDLEEASVTIVLDGDLAVHEVRSGE